MTETVTTILLASLCSFVQAADWNHVCSNDTEAVSIDKSSVSWEGPYPQACLSQWFLARWERHC